MVASSTGCPSTVADRSSSTKSSSPAGALDARQRAEAGPQVVELLGDGRVVDRHVVHRDGDAVDVGQRDLRADVDLGGEGEVVAVRDLGDLDVRTADRVHVVRGRHGLGVLGRDRRVHDLVEHHAPAQARLEDAGGRLARPEAGDPHLLGDLAVRPVEVGLELVEGHLDVDADARRTEALDGALHGVTPRNWCSVGRGRGRAAATTTDRGGSPVRDVSATAGRFWSRV